MNKPFELYKNTAAEVCNLLSKNDCASLADVKIIYNLIMGFPYCVSTQGQYIFHGELHSNIERLPIKALEILAKADC